MKDDFSKGVVFYTKGGVVVGVLTWNIFGKMDLARKVPTLAACWRTHKHFFGGGLQGMHLSFHSCR